MQWTAATTVPAAAPPVATVSAAAPAIIPTPIAIFAQLGKDALPLASVRLTGLLIQ